MYDPKFTYTDKLVSTLVKLENARTAITSMDITYENKYKLAQTAKTLDVFHLGHFLELDMTLKDADKIASGMKLDHLKDDNAYKLKNFRDALDFSRSQMSDSYAEVDLNTIMHFHKMIMNGWKKGWESSFRNQEIDNDKIEYELYELIEWYKSVTITITPVVRIGIFIYRFIELYPFAFGNKLTILSYTDYLMFKNGFASKVYSSVLKIFNSNEMKFFEAMDYSRKNFDLAIWLEIFTHAMFRDLMEIRENVSEFIKEEEKSKDQPFLDLNKRQLKVLRYLQTVPMIKREDYCHMMEVSTMTAFRDLNDLVRKKLIKIEGQGRGTKYRLASM
jgi:Fic family protein